MSCEAKPPDIDASLSEEQESLRSGTRTPRPYYNDGLGIQQCTDRPNGHATEDGLLVSHDDSHGLPDNAPWTGRSGQTSTTGSESGTEADDERPSFVKALPAPHLRPRKGLKTGELNEDALLTPSQLDDEGRRISQGYFKRTSEDNEVSKDQEQEEREKVLRRRLAEFARRSSEVVLTAVIIGCVLCGKDVLQFAKNWRLELLTQIVVIATLILAYPVKLSIVDSQSQARKLWQRFRVPASFDPATVLYPTLLPVLVALSVSPANQATVLPNVILGLSSLPQRLFPRSSRIGGINALHWFVSVMPMIVAQNTTLASRDWQTSPLKLKCEPTECLWPETLVSLYPLHHALLQPLHYLTTTSLLISELHLLSAALINLLLMAASPQMIMLKACLWIGGVTLFVLCARVLHWNVTLMRVPKWKFRRPGHTAEERKSLVDAVSDLINVQRATAASKSADHDDSDADEDEPVVSIKQRPNGTPKLSMSNLGFTAFDSATDHAPKSAVEPRLNGRIPFPDPGYTHPRPRRNTLPVHNPPERPRKEPNDRKKDHPPSVPWYLRLTPAQAQRRKWLYAGYAFGTMVLVILVPVRNYVLENALHGQEPIGWAVGYLFGQVEVLRNVIKYLGLDSWVAMPSPPGSWMDLSLTFPLDIPTMRATVGAANVRLLLIGYWASVLLAGLLAVFSLTAYVEVDTRRKVFHGVMVGMMLPSTFIDPCACALALALILAVFLLLEVIRAGQVPPVGNAIGRFVAPYVDGRDLRGPVVVSHIFLLIGCAVPLWLSLASIPRSGEEPWMGWELKDGNREVAMNAGVICVGMGDAAASLIGRRYGRHKWLWVGGKSLEGSAAFAVAVTIGLVATKAWLVAGGWHDTTGTISGHLGSFGALQCAVAWLVTLTKAVSCACAASFMEAVLTGANDNVVVPVALWLLVKGVRV